VLTTQRNDHVNSASGGISFDLQIAGKFRSVFDFRRWMKNMNLSFCLLVCLPVCLFSLLLVFPLERLRSRAIFLSRLRFR